ncbi:hypothetical protein B484DRAFT_408365 [Ochromonadaceae sp. CCMP2298]|nr:hypothetical protein B484DRAFT_408365 [Ochromonadaceae sp. CCMP2298]
MENLSLSTRLLLYNAAICSVPPVGGKLLVRVFEGGAMSEQSIPFMGAWKELQLDNEFDIEIIDVQKIKKRRWTDPKMLIDWLLASHIHFVISHPHQGLEQLYWNIDELQVQLLRLQYHNGFPNGRFSIDFR